MSSPSVRTFHPSASDPVYPPTRPPKIQSIQIPLEVVFDRETTMKQISRLENLIRKCRRDIKKFIDVSVSTENVDIRRHKSGDHFVGRSAGKFNEELRRRQEELGDLRDRLGDLRELCKENPVTKEKEKKEEIKEEEVDPTPVSSLFESGLSFQDFAKTHIPFVQYPMIYRPMMWSLPHSTYPYMLYQPPGSPENVNDPMQGVTSTQEDSVVRKNYIRYYDKRKTAPKSRQSALSQYHAGRGPRPPPHELTDKTLLIERKSVDPVLTADSQGNPLNVRCFHSVNGQPRICDCTYDNNVYILSESSQRMRSKGLLVIDQDLLYLQKLDLMRNRTRTCDNRWLTHNSLLQAPLPPNHFMQAPLSQNPLGQGSFTQSQYPHNSFSQASLTQSPFNRSSFVPTYPYARPQPLHHL